MSFWMLADAPDQPALIGLDGTLSRGELAARADAFVKTLPDKSRRKRLGLVLCRNEAAAIIAYLGALRGGDAVMLLNEQTDATLLAEVLSRFEPDWIAQHEGAQDWEAYQATPFAQGWELLVRNAVATGPEIHSDVAVLLSTSGSTGSPKMVKLSHANLAANAASIADYLAIDAGTRVITTLPSNYSYGMSVVNSHLHAGAALVMTDASLMSREFWDAFEQHQVNSMPGVPYTYQLLHRLNPRKLPLASLRTLTQAGGHLSAPLQSFFHELSQELGWRFFVMYGQTEAAPRISYVPPEALARKQGSIGIAVPGGRLSLSADGELIYEGPNVMMGYAQSRADLAGGDELQGRLATGDLAEIDEDGFAFLRGRLKRFIKIHGNRISLDDIEQRLEAEFGPVVIVGGRDEKLRVRHTDGVDPAAIKSLISGLYRLHASVFAIEPVDTSPHTSSGKKDYTGLNA
jgi:acyl-CoA synthetase (AMP-forming)/AMP-acid ligase II